MTDLILEAGASPSPSFVSRAARLAAPDAAPRRALKVDRRTRLKGLGAALFGEAIGVIGGVQFLPQRNWRSPRTDASYPVQSVLRTGTVEWALNPLQDDQELDSRQSTGSVYWEGAVTVSRAGKPVGRGYFELTGYVKPLKF